MSSAGRSDAWWHALVVGHAAGATRTRAARAERTAWGWMLSTPALPTVWGVNRAQVVPGAGGLEPEATIAAVEAAHLERGLRHGALDVRSTADATALAPVLRAAGWIPDPLTVMVGDPAAVAGAADARGRAARAGTTVAAEDPRGTEGLRAAEPGATTDAARRWVLAPGHDVEHLVARDAAGEVVGTCALHLASLHVEVDDLVVHPRHRGRGTGTAIVAAAASIAAARDGGLGLLAQAGGRPEGWYRALGLRAVGTTLRASRPPSAR